MKGLHKINNKNAFSIMNGAQCPPCSCADPCGKCYVMGIDVYDHALIRALNGGYSLASRVDTANREYFGIDPYRGNNIQNI